MSAQDSDQLAPEGRGRRRTRWRALAVLTLLAAVAAVVLLVRGPDHTARQSTLACLSTTAVPEVRNVAPAALGDLREEVARVVPQRVGRLYEEGTVHSRAAWNDEEPAPPSASPTERRPGGYEMRWWAPNGDDVVADVLVFASPAAARHYLVLASSARCHEGAVRGATLRPPRGRNLSWMNPDGVLQADVFLVRGSRVYRVADAPAGSSPEEVRSSGGLRHAFATIDVLACLLPTARCVPVQSGVPA